MIAVAFALPAESSGFLKLLEHRTRAGENIGGKIGAADVRVLHTGVGENIARHRTAAFLDREQPRLVISSGFAGAVADELEVGDLLVAENFSDASLVASAAAALTDCDVHVGRLATASGIVDSPADRAAFAEQSRAVAVDMETAFIAAACAARGVPMLSLRAISDSAAAPLPAPASVLFDVDRQRTSYGALLLHVMKDPGAISKLVRFASQVATARRSLTRALELVIRGGFDAA